MQSVIPKAGFKLHHATNVALFQLLKHRMMYGRIPVKMHLSLYVASDTKNVVCSPQMRHITLLRWVVHTVKSQGETTTHKKSKLT